MNEREHFTPGSIEYVSPTTVATPGFPVRLSFRPWGRRRLGDPDPEHPGYQILDARARITGPSGSLYLQDVAGRELMLGDGRYFTPDSGINDDLPDGVEELNLSREGPILGVQTTEGGYVAAGSHVVVLIPN